MKTIYLIIFTLILCFPTFAQESAAVVKTVKGKVINADSNEPISFTNIGIEGTLHGTASDEEGNFELKITEEFVAKNIYFSAVGYKNLIFPVNNLFEKEFNVIKLKSQSYDIDDVDIAAQNKVLIRILRMASENIPYNFIQGPYNLTAQYSSEKRVDNLATRQTAEVLIYDKTGYSNPSKKDAYQSLKYSVTAKESDADYRFSTGATNIDELLEMDWARSATSVLNPGMAGGFNLKLMDEPRINGQEFWVISFSQDNINLAGSGDFYATAFKGEITVNKEDYSVIRIEGKTESSKNSNQGKSLAVGKSSTNYLTDVVYDFVIDYENLKPSKIELNKTYSLEGKKVTENSALEITRVDAANVKQLNSRQYFTGQ
jgi:hypothetical protein